MNYLKDFLEKETTQKILWRMFNEVLGLSMSLILYLSDAGVGWAVMAYPFARRGSEFITRYVNEKYIGQNDGKTNVQK